LPSNAVVNGIRVQIDVSMTHLGGLCPCKILIFADAGNVYSLSMHESRLQLPSIALTSSDAISSKSMQYRSDCSGVVSDGCDQVFTQGSATDRWGSLTAARINERSFGYQVRAALLLSLLVG
jgi:hypothetical protein